jgi:RNA polymerase sigma factor (sigma-70 family)
MTSSRRRFQAAVLALFYISPESVTAFRSTPTFGRQRPTQTTTTLSVVNAATISSTTTRRSALSSAPTTRTTTRPTDGEQQNYLNKAVELRRLKQIRTSFSHTTTPLALELSRASGYGDDLVAYEVALADGQLAREALVTRNMGLVYYCVNEIIGKQSSSKKRLQTLSREDLIQEGAIGLARALEKWNPEIGGKFSTYAVYWVRAAILRCIAERDDLVRVPEHVSTAVRKMTRAAAQMGISIDGDNLLSSVSGSKQTSWKEAEAAKELAELAGLTEKQLTEAIKVRARRLQGIASFESWMQKGRDLEVDAGAMEASTEASDLPSKEMLRQELSRFLRPREMEALSWRYGLISTEAPSLLTDKKKSARNQKDYLARAEGELYGSTTAGRWGEAMTFNEVGQRMQVSAEYGRRLCHAALTKLRLAAEEGNLSPAALMA